MISISLFLKSVLVFHYCIMDLVEVNEDRRNLVLLLQLLS